MDDDFSPHFVWLYGEVGELYPGLYSFCFCIFLSLSACMLHAAFFGVKKNDAKLLARASSIGSQLGCIFTLLTFLFLVECGVVCRKDWFHGFFIGFAVFWVAAQARKLKGWLETGAMLTRMPAVPDGVAIGRPRGSSHNGRV